MTSPRWAVDIGGTRWYRHPTKHNGEPRWLSVTHTVAALPKEAIPRWAAKAVAEWAVDHQDQWRSLPRDDWKETEEGFDGKARKVTHKGAVSVLKAKPWEERDRAAERGSTVHAVIEKMLAGEPYAVEAATFPWVAAARRFVDEVRPEPRLTEVSIYNDEHLYAGSADFTGQLRGYPELGGNVLVDWKTGRGVYDDMAVQLVAYAKGGYYLDGADREQEWRPPSAAAIVHLGPDGYQVYRSPLRQDLWRVFLAALDIRRWQQDTPGLVKLGDPEADWNRVWRDEKVALLRSRIEQCDTERRLALTLEFKEQGWPTRPEQLSDAQLESALALAHLHVEADTVESVPPARRPMP